MDTFSKRFSLEGKVALVTGAAYGIGFAIAEAYAMAGAKIAFNCRGQHHLDQALADYKAKGIDAKGYICDVTNEEDVKKMVADIEKELGTIDILVNNAGIIKRIPMTEMSVEEFRQVIDIDLNAPFIMSKAVIPGMIKKGHGKPAVLLHDLDSASSVYEWKAMIDRLSKNHTIYAIDLLGCGYSDKPKMTYTNYLFVQMLNDFVREVIRGRTDIIASNSSCSVALSAIHMEEGLYHKLMMINPKDPAKMAKVPRFYHKFYKYMIEIPVFQ